MTAKLVENSFRILKMDFLDIGTLDVKKKERYIYLYSKGVKTLATW